MWMGQWCPYVFCESSNWKELKTLLLTLQAIRDNQANAARHSTLFYFTDNSTTYWVCNSGSSRSPGLHALVEQIGLIKLELSLELQVIHVSGTVMIEQGTDGLSRGVWASSLHPLFTQDDGTLWDSYYFRHTFLYPSLYRQQDAGDAYLRAFTGQGSNSIPAKFWSLHSWRRGARTHCARANNPGCLRKATTAEIYEHARWRRERASEAIDMIYLDLPLLDRLKITYCCHYHGDDLGSMLLLTL
jgi:hypothetical protein